MKDRYRMHATYEALKPMSSAKPHMYTVRLKRHDFSYQLTFVYSLPSLMPQFMLQKCIEH